MECHSTEIMCRKIEARAGEEVEMTSCFAARGGSLHISGDFTLHVHLLVVDGGCNPPGGPEIEKGMHIFVVSKAAWEMMPEDVIQFEEGPPR